MPPRRFEGADPISWLHRQLYPVNSKYYWYRQGKVKRSTLKLKYLRFFLLSFLVAFAGSGSMMFFFMMCLTFAMAEWQSLQVNDASVIMPAVSDGPAAFWESDLFRNASRVAQRALVHDTQDGAIQFAIHDPTFILGWMVTAGTFTFMVYYYGAQTIHNYYYVKNRDKAKLWKCQPDRWPTDELFLEEKLTGCFNAFVSGFAGTGLFFLHQNYPFLKLYYSTGIRGFGHYFASCLLVYFWVDFYSYWIHRILHMRWIYKYVHKWHHRYKAPTAFGAFAIHPIEYICFQTAGIWCCAIFPIHVMSFLTVTTFVAFHNQVDHSGVYYEGDLPWVPSTKYHDDHHKYFHLNYGVTLVLWDWLFGTLRQSDRVYGEDIFVGEQDQAGSALATKTKKAN
eukprot:CAMPEP_0202072418 /NCGR_PEP_ID=MMETSP0964-20121228/2408_1 /ASSEMBLY_ACC=CAM_ASM_000500 /TAXON_ID=4773 /ORGANISM="Schizochytrium aggregatum, Strain ATCC28209" /LENGTH=393 /DNA_ID=CAMNT_0048639447 /DNA_START=183 /DNA_END=1364 /DNA_ORIENTATION=+